ncbi:LOW QUALITY PROTEIN: histidine acid phosphatase [Colletotrichum navitas]|uniref:Histidine acid phosphatase n=1 Tax=Colletotrichum navitas TaxID=681940 RepID=A0AAD8PNC2_9PEZI|nr:LOW QUALITY PROTEIN: histidine acid phosphatase [Colletotrichum navitas]KAK1570308.1 LOW QUALITY PROTEIN: histidine acid phosphatase [Colletotrichum navitas]
MPHYNCTSGQTLPGGIEPKSHFWSWNSPFYPVPSEIDPSIPAGCEATFVQVLSRHGSKYPKTQEMQEAKAIIKHIRTTVTHGEGLEILKSNDLIPRYLSPFGKKEALDSGISFYKRYRHLATNHDPFIRSVSEERGDPDTTRRIQIIPMTKGFNNSLHHGGCPAFEKTVNARTSEAPVQWIQEYSRPITEQANKALLPRANLIPSQIKRLMSLCPINTVINGIESKVCNLFTTEEFKNDEYGDTLSKYYSWGPGNPLGPTQGVGFTNELIAQLTQQLVVNHTSTNTTLTGDPKTFLLNKKIYANFTCGLFNGAEPLSQTHMTPLARAKGFSMSRLIPFASRMYVEKLQCSGEANEEFVRVLVNDRVMLPSGCKVDRHGRCKLSEFVEGLKFARAGGHWNKCFH